MDPLGYRAISASWVRVAKVLKSLVLAETTACGEDCSNKCLGSHHPKLGFADFGFRGVEFVVLDCLGALVTLVGVDGPMVFMFRASSRIRFSPARCRTERLCSQRY